MKQIRLVTNIIKTVLKYAGIIGAVVKALHVLQDELHKLDKETAEDVVKD